MTINPPVLIRPRALVEIETAQASNDADMVALWLGRYHSPHTKRRYEADAARFLAFVTKPLQTVTVRDIQAYGASLQGQAAATIAGRLAAIKSLIARAHRIGYLAFDVGAPVTTPPVRDNLAARIISEWDVQALLNAEPRARNGTLLRLIYGAGLRISEVCDLHWHDLTPREEAGQITIFGEGGKTRIVLPPLSLWSRLQSFRGQAEPDAPVFRSPKGGPLQRRQVDRIVKAACKRARLPPAVSAHWLRHAHVSHALDRGALVHVVRETVGHASLETTTRYSHARPGDSSARYLKI